MVVLALIAAVVMLSAGAEGGSEPVAILADGPYAGLQIEIADDQTTISMRPLEIEGLGPSEGGLPAARYKRSPKVDSEGRPIFTFDGSLD